LAAILNFKVKQGQNTKNNPRYEFLDPKLVKKHILHKYVEQKDQTVNLTTPIGSHFEFGALTEFPRPFRRDMAAKFFL